MSATPTFPRADKAAREVDPMILAQALDHIARTAKGSRTQTRRIRWIEQRAVIALAGREYRDIDVDLPEHATEERMVDLKFKCTKLRKDNAELLEALTELLAAEVAIFPAAEAGQDAQTAWGARKTAARRNAAEILAKATGSANHG